MLTGHVPDAAARDEIRAVAKKGAPSVAVTDELKVAGGAPKDFARAVAAALPALERLSSGALTFSDNGVALKGEAPFAGARGGHWPSFGERPAPGLRLRGPADRARSRPVAGRPPSYARPLTTRWPRTPLLFDGPDATLSDSATPALDALATLLPRGRGARFEIIGHVGGPGIEEVNRALAKQRAQAVIDRLTALGVDPADLAPVGVAGQADRRPAPSKWRRNERRFETSRLEMLARWRRPMLYVLTLGWVWFAAAGALGLLVGFATATRGRGGEFSSWWVILAAFGVLAGGFAGAELGLVPGRAGLQLEIGLLAALAYFIGLPIGGGAKSLLPAPAAAPMKPTPVVVRGRPRDEEFPAANSLPLPSPPLPPSPPPLPSPPRLTPPPPNRRPPRASPPRARPPPPRTNWRRRRRPPKSTFPAGLPKASRGRAAEWPTI